MISQMLSQRIKQIAPSGIRKFFDIANQMENVISLGVGEPDFATPWHIRDEAIYSLEKKRTAYTANAGLWELRQEIATYLETRLRLGVQPAGPDLGHGGRERSHRSGSARPCGPWGRGGIVPEPTYVSYLPGVVLAGEAGAGTHL